MDSGLSCAATARKYNTTPKTVAKWVKRCRAEGVDGLRDRSSRPLSSDSQTPQATCDAVEALRRQRYTGNQIARELGISPAAPSAAFCGRRGLNKLSALEPAEPVRRYEREKAGELIPSQHQEAWSHRFRGTSHHWTAVRRSQPTSWHRFENGPCIDDASRVAFVQVMADQRKESAVAFLQAAVAYYAKLGVRIERVMTDNGSCYRSKTFRAACTPSGSTPNLHQAIHAQNQR